ncbi:MAG: Arm DNA-binding domain-containing protein, partial [Synergistaceae bacterium]|nr:Arm DNA-binding domain-containing protein [Synergistaceae bacterium]
MNLSETRIRAARAREKRYELQDGDGLILEVMTSGRKYWRYRHTQDGKRTRATIGEYPHVGLREARAMRDGMRGRVQDGLPAKEAKKTADPTFRETAEQWHAAHGQTLKNERDANR